MSKPTRRSFLEHTFYLAAAGLAAAQRMPDVRADEASAPPPRASGDERVRIAVIGLHQRGLNHLESFSDDQSVDIVAICDVDDAQFAKAQQKIKDRNRPAAKQYKDLRKLFDDKDVQAVSIATPNHWHTLAGIWAMQAGKDVYVEKPVSHNVSEGRRLEQARVKYDRICAAGTQSRSNRAVQAAIQYIHEGKLGQVLLSRGLCYKKRDSIGHYDDSPTPPGVDYDIWQGPAPLRPFNKNRFLYDWHWNWAYGNGDIGNQGIHQMDVARWAINKQFPSSRSQLVGDSDMKTTGKLLNTQLAFFDFGGPQLLFEVRGSKTPPVEKLMVGNIVYGTEGMIAISFNESAVVMDKSGKVVMKFKGGATNHFSNFTAAVRTHNQKDLRAPVLEGHYSSALCHLANTSYRLGSQESFEAVAKTLSDNKDMSESFHRFEEHLEQNKLKLADLHCQSGPSLAYDGQAENFGSNAAANAMLTREYRAPFVVPETL